MHGDRRRGVPQWEGRSLEDAMHCSTRTCVRIAHTALSSVALAALAVAAQMSANAAEYKMTVNKDRLVNSANEPQNWLMMNGDYGSPPHSQLRPKRPRKRQ